MSRPFFKWDPTTTIALTIITVVGSQLLASVLIGLYPAIRDMTQLEAEIWWRDSSAARFVFILIAEAIAIGFVFKLVSWAKLKLSSIGITEVKWAHLARAVVTYGIYFLTYLAIFIAATNLLPVDPEQKQEIGFEGAFSASSLMMVFVALVVLPPLAEEIIFRGLLFSSMRAKYKFWTSALITSIPFGIAHLQLWAGVDNIHWLAAIDTFILSFFLCHIRERSKSLWPAVFLHGIKNLVAFSILFGPRVFILFGW